MILSNKTIKKLGELITHETKYRKGYELVEFFNELGFNDTYGQGFPSRATYTEERLKQINGKPEIDKCIKNLFTPIEYVDNLNQLNDVINDFNKYLSFDGWKVKIRNKDVLIIKADDLGWFEEHAKSKEIINENQLLKDDIPLIDLNKLQIDNNLKNILNERIEEIQKAIKVNNPLSIIFLAGSSLEGILLSYASLNLVSFNSSTSSPKDKNRKVKKIYDWKLSELIDVSCDVGLLKKDVKKFSHVLRDFRNYIHPFQQLQQQFSPDMNTAKICYQVLKLAMLQLEENNIVSEG